MADRIWTAGAPALVLLAYVALGLVVYRLRRITKGEFRDAEAEARQGGGLTVRSVRLFFTWLIRPWVDLLVKFEVPPNAITSLSLALSLAAGVALAMGRFALGGWLYVAAGMCDFLDGSVARRAGRATRGGAVLDSVLDRCSEAAILVGLAWFYRDRWVLAPVLAALVGSMLVPYVRARGEAIGAAMAGVGFFQRPERVVILSATISLSPILEALIAPEDARPIHRIAVAGIVLIAVGTLFTAATRTVYLVRSLSPATDQTLAPKLWIWLTTLAATACDYGAFLLIVDGGWAPPAVATMIGYAVGASAGLLVFGVRARGALPHGGSSHAWWVFAVGSAALLSGGGVQVLGLIPGLDVSLAWLAVRVVVYLTWTRPLVAEGLRDRLLTAAAPRTNEG